MLSECQAFGTQIPNELLAEIDAIYALPQPASITLIKNGAHYRQRLTSAENPRHPNRGSIDRLVRQLSPDVDTVPIRHFCMAADDRAATRNRAVRWLIVTSTKNKGIVALQIRRYLP